MLIRAAARRTYQAGSEPGGMADLRAEFRERNHRPRRPQKSPAEGRAVNKTQGRNQAWGGVLRGAAMRLRRRRLQPRAAPAPSRGRGPGAATEGEGGAPITT